MCEKNFLKIPPFIEITTHSSFTFQILLPVQMSTFKGILISEIFHMFFKIKTWKYGMVKYQQKFSENKSRYHHHWVRIMNMMCKKHIPNPDLANTCQQDLTWLKEGTQKFYSKNCTKILKIKKKRIDYMIPFYMPKLPNCIIYHT